MTAEISPHITIGGCVARVFVPELCLAICQERVGSDSRGTPFDPVNEQHLLSSLNANGHLCLYADGAAASGFEILEPFLQEHQIPFDRRAGAKFKTLGTTLFFRPETGRNEFITDERQGILCQAQPLWPLETTLAQARRDAVQRRGRQAIHLMEQCLQLLRNHLPQIRPLPAFEID